jgi:hypothetical protein
MLCIRGPSDSEREDGNTRTRPAGSPVSVTVTLRASQRPSDNAAVWRGSRGSDGARVQLARAAQPTGTHAARPSCRLRPGGRPTEGAAGSGGARSRSRCRPRLRAAAMANAQGPWRAPCWARDKGSDSW